MTTIIGLLWPSLRRFWSYAALAAVSLMAWHFDNRALANADAVRTQAAQFKQAQADATMIAQQALRQEQAEYQAKATETDNAYQSRLAAARSAADQYISSHRLHITAAASAGGTTIARAQIGSSAVPANMPANAVVVSPNDVQACTDAVTYADKAHDWAMSINP